jgi:hypothetical protein
LASFETKEELDCFKEMNKGGKQILIEPFSFPNKN